MFDNSKIFAHAPQYHWHATTTEVVTAVDQEVRERIVSIADLHDHFGHHIELHEEELRAHSERLAEGSQVVRLVEPLDVCITSLEK